LNLTPENIRSGFWWTGLVPLDFDVLRRRLDIPNPTFNSTALVVVSHQTLAPVQTLNPNSLRRVQVCPSALKSGLSLLSNSYLVMPYKNRRTGNTCADKNKTKTTANKHNGVRPHEGSLKNIHVALHMTAK
jgi:hypothetical protein